LKALTYKAFGVAGAEGLEPSARGFGDRVYLARNPLHINAFRKSRLALTLIWHQLFKITLPWLFSCQAVNACFA